MQEGERVKSTRRTLSKICLKSHCDPVGNPESSVHRRSPKSIKQSPNSKFLGLSLSTRVVILILLLLIYFLILFFIFFLQYCTEGVKQAKEVPKDLTDKALQIRFHLLNNIKIVDFLLKSHAAINLQMQHHLKGLT